MKSFGWVLLSMALVSACGGGGGGGATDRGTDAPALGEAVAGEPYFPFAANATWHYETAVDFYNGGIFEFTHDVRIVGTRTVDGVSASVFSSTDSEDFGLPHEELQSISSSGVTYHGNDDVDDMFTAAVVPFPDVTFPLRLNQVTEQFDRRGVDVGLDLDADGESERADMRSTVRVAAFEPVSGPLGVFPDTVKLERVTTVTMTFSSVDEEATVTETEWRWFARGIGLVRLESHFASPDPGAAPYEERWLHELAGYSVGGESAGSLGIVTLATDVSEGIMDFGAPGSLALASDGTDFLLVFCDSTGPDAGVRGVLVSADGQQKSLAITPASCINGPRQQVAFGGGQYLVTFNSAEPVSGAEVRGVRISPDGELLDPPSGFLISSADDAPSNNARVRFDEDHFVVVFQKHASPSTFAQPGIFAVEVGLDGGVSGESPIWQSANTVYGFDFAKGGDVFLLAFVEQTGDGLYGDAEDVHGLVFDRTLTPLGSSFPIVRAPHAQNAPSVAFDGTRFLAVWSDARNHPLGAGAANWDVYGAGVTPEGVVLGTGPIDTSPSTPDVLQLHFTGAEYLLIEGATNRPPFGPFSQPQAAVFLRRISPDGTVLDGAPSETPEIGAEPHRLCTSGCWLRNPSLARGDHASLLVWLDDPGAKDIRGVIRASE